MKACSYCGRENEAAAPRCQDCGTEFYTEPQAEVSIVPTLKSALRQPAHIVWLVAAVVMAQAVFRFSPHDSRLGEGDVESIDSVINLWVSAGISTVLVSFGVYLKSRRKERQRAGSLESH
jgi:hypothetical protein